MHRPLIPIVGCVLLGVTGLSSFGGPAAPDRPGRFVDFAREVRPILSKNCFPCHGPDDSHRAAKLRLDERDAATREHRKGKIALVPGNLAKSELYRRITNESELERMPPAETGNHLTAEQIDVLKRWIEQGAAYAPHWAYLKPNPPTIPSFSGDSQSHSFLRTPIDRFILAKLREAGLEPNSEADKYTLLRRVSLDLRGLPPTLQELDEFEKDASPNAYEKTVDRFLQDPAYGERWARMWLDLARYADSAGYGSDPLRPNMWRYRDWVIEAFNRNLPFDQFTMEQLAGDLLALRSSLVALGGPTSTPGGHQEQRTKSQELSPLADSRVLATAFHRNTMTNTEGGTDDEEFRVAAVKDRVDTTMQVWMGLTFGCAKCHNHKYEPISQLDYYRLFAILNQTADNDQPNETPTIPAPTPDMILKNRQIDEQVSKLNGRMASPGHAVVASWVLQSPLTPPPVIAVIRVEIAKLEKSRPKPPNLPVMVELPPDKRRTTHLMIKGNFLDKGEKVEPELPAAMFSPPKPGPQGAGLGRLELARWLVHPDNPLTARVAVNRFWAQLFGVGLVETEEDFGTQGELPSHPELLDWLALEYQRLGWDTKKLLKLMVMSGTYRQSSSAKTQAPRPKADPDPRNRLLSRGPRFRLEAELVRDQALAVSGLLSRKIGGPSVYPPQPPGLWQAAFNGERTWATSAGEDRYRRGLYTFWRRTIPYPSMATFDAPSRETCSVRRIRTNTPLQAFVTLNDPVYVECAQALARRIMSNADTAEARTRFALRLCLCRPPSEEQVKQVLALYETELAHYRQDPAAAAKLAADPLGPLPDGLDAAEAAAWTVVANVLLNLDAVLARG
jgi:hypothetical protein